jgi:hypothetical protein
MSTLTQILERFCNHFLLVSEYSKLLVPELAMPCKDSMLCYQDYDQRDNNDTVRVDIFYHCNQENFSMNVKFINEVDDPDFQVYKHISIIQVVDIIGEYDGWGSWHTKCGLLLGYLTGWNGSDRHVKCLWRAQYHFPGIGSLLLNNQTDNKLIECIKKYDKHAHDHELEHQIILHASDILN